MPGRYAGLKVLLDEPLQVDAADTNESLSRTKADRRKHSVLDPGEDELVAGTEYACGLCNGVEVE